MRTHSDRVRLILTNCGEPWKLLHRGSVEGNFRIKAQATFVAQSKRTVIRDDTQSECTQPMLLKRIISKSARIVVLGVGYVGLPMLVRAAKVGYPTLGIDIKADLIGQLSLGQSHVTDVSSEELTKLVSAGKARFFCVDALTDNEDLEVQLLIANCDIFLVSVPTPMTRFDARVPDTTYLESCANLIEQCLLIGDSKERLLIVESTTYPGNSEAVFGDLVVRSHKQLILAYSPERINPGTNGLVERVSKIWAVRDPEDAGLLEQFYSNILEGGHLQVPSISAAELVKCAENSFRLFSIAFSMSLAMNAQRFGLDVWSLLDRVRGNDPESIFRNLAGAIESLNFASVNMDLSILGATEDALCWNVENGALGCSQFELVVARIADAFTELTMKFLFELKVFCSHPQISADFSSVVHAINTKPFGLDVCFPGPGVGGHCIPVDALYLLYRAKQLGLQLSIIDQADEINRMMPGHVMRLVRVALSRRGKRIARSLILILGVTYKENVPDIRESRALELMNLLRAEGAELLFCDPARENTPGIRQDLKLTGEYSPLIVKTSTLESVLTDSGIDCVVIFTAHDHFRNRVFSQLENSQQISIVDTRNVLCTSKSNSRAWKLTLGKSSDPSVGIFEQGGEAATASSSLLR